MKLSERIEKLIEERAKKVAKRCNYSETCWEWLTEDKLNQYYNYIRCNDVIAPVILELIEEEILHPTCYTYTDDESVQFFFLATYATVLSNKGNRRLEVVLFRDRIPIKKIFASREDIIKFVEDTVKEILETWKDFKSV